jgi:hypothetical protein
MRTVLESMRMAWVTSAGRTLSTYAVATTKSVTAARARVLEALRPDEILVAAASADWRVTMHDGRAAPGT